MSPTIAGLILAILISWASGQLWIGLTLRRAGLLLTPEEAEPPHVVRRANALQLELAQKGQDEIDSLRVIHDDADFRAAHDLFLPHAVRHQRGEIEADRAVAEAKLNDAESIEDAIAWLKPKERFVVLHDRALIALLARLPHEAPLPQSVAAAG
jgi:membrane glycosyltransferase